jgi:methionine-rich copper-binding protein CopC
VKRILTAGLLAATLLGGAAALAPSAAAHSELVSSDPADGASLDAPPTTVSFTFNEPLLPDFVRFIATDPAGETGDLPVSAVEGPTATIDWPAGAPGGEWTVQYRVVSQDGHPIEGGITFTYAAASPTASPSSPSPSPTSAAPTSATPTSAAPSPSTSPAADTSDGTSGVLIASLAVGAIVIIGVVVALVARRRT